MTDQFSPIHWTKYFTLKDDIEIDSGTFRIYRRGVEGPLVFFIHGGGFSALTWAVLSKLLTGQVKCQCLAVDMRGHGDTKCNDESDFAIETLARDIIKIIFAMYPTEAPPIVLVGHSLGGAVAVHVANMKMIPSLAGLVVIDVVEGSALASLHGMASIIANRPKSFASLEQAITWSVRSKMLRNAQSAQVSFPGQLVSTETGETATAELDKREASSHLKKTDSANGHRPQLLNSRSSTLASTREEEEIDGHTAVDRSVLQTVDTSVNHAMSHESCTDKPVPRYSWRIDLMRTQPFWPSWFTGLSKIFLSVREPKLLLLADTDRLDKDLTIGQMQGKFQLSLIPQCGHAIQEDSPAKVAECLSHFLVRYRFTEAKPSCEL